MSEDVSFERALERLQEIVRKLEGADLELEESLSLFDEGMQLLQKAERKLSESEGRVKQILVDREGHRQATDVSLTD